MKFFSNSFKKGAGGLITNQDTSNQFFSMKKIIPSDFLIKNSQIGSDHYLDSTSKAIFEKKEN